jgi:hypothetical protein
MAGDQDDNGELKELVAATKSTHRSLANVDAVGIAANVIEARGKILEAIAKSGGQLTTYPAVVGAPYLIWANPSDILVDSHIEQWNNRARVKRSRSGGDAFFSDIVSFYYFWDNPSSENYTLVNVASSLVTKGLVTATGNTGFLSGGYAGLSATTSLIFYQWAGEPTLSPQANQIEYMYSVEARGRGFWSRETGKIDTKRVFYEAGVEYRNFPVPPGARAIVEVRLILQTTIQPDGSTGFDFSSTAQDGYVLCPSLLITVLSGVPIAIG